MEFQDQEPTQSKIMKMDSERIQSERAQVHIGPSVTQNQLIKENKTASLFQVQELIMLMYQLMSQEALFSEHKASLVRELLLKTQRTRSQRL